MGTDVLKKALEPYLTHICSKANVCKKEDFCPHKEPHGILATCATQGTAINLNQNGEHQCVSTGLFTRCAEKKASREVRTD